MRPVKLSVLTLADRHLRFCLMDRDNRFYNCSDMHATGCQPLFLGSDILHDTLEWGKNLCRIHARFAKQGLATKLVFTDCRIDGLRKGNEAYFYSVHGLFRAAFEYHSFPLQHRCLQLLTDVWMKVSEESQPRLEGQYQVAFQNQVPASCRPASAAAGQHDAECEDSNTPVPPMLLPLKAQPIPSISSKLCGPGATSDRSLTNAQLDSSSARHLVKESWKSLASTFQNVGTQTDDSCDWANDSQEAVVLETVCQMCRIRRRMTEREKADVDSLRRSAKRRKTRHSLEGEESVCDVNRREKTGMISDTVPGDKMPEKGERISRKVMAMFAPALSSTPHSNLVLNTSSGDCSGQFLSEVNHSKLSSLTCKEHEAGELHVGKSASSAECNDSVCGLGQSCDVDESFKVHNVSHIDQQTCLPVSQCNRISNRRVPLDVTERVSDLHHIQREWSHAQTQTDHVVQNWDGSFGETELSSVITGVESRMDSDCDLTVTAHDQQAEVSSESNSQASAQTVSDDPPMKNVHQDFHQTNHVDAVLRVQSWMEEVHKMKVLLDSDNAKTSTCSAGQTCEDSVNAVKASDVEGVQLEVMLVVLEFLCHIVDGVTTSSDISTFSQILMLVQNAAEKSAKFAAASREWQVASALMLSMLTELGAWLGEQFHLFQAAISQRVTTFKQKYINNISDLPPAIDMIAELFPPCMVVFTGAWIGLTDMQVAEAIEKDHCYENPSRAVPENQPPKRNPYPLVQLVLELLNNSLVSGIAHVVFCKL